MLQVRDHAATGQTLRIVRPATATSTLSHDGRPARPGPAGHRLKAKLDHPPLEAVSFTFMTEGWPPACRPMIGLAYNTTAHCYPRGTLTARHAAVSVTPPPWFAFAHWGGGRGSIPTIRMDRLPPSVVARAPVDPRHPRRRPTATGGFSSIVRLTIMSTDGTVVFRVADDESTGIPWLFEATRIDVS